MTTRSSALAAVGVTLVLWASAFVGIRYLGAAFSPGTLTLGRLVVGSVALGILTVSTRSWQRPDRAQWLAIIAIGILWFGIYNLALNAGEHSVDAGTAAMLLQISPVLIAVLAAFFLSERFTRWLTAGLLVAFAGVALIGVSTSHAPASGSHENSWSGVLLCLLAAAVYSVSVILQKPLVARLSAIQVTFLACLIGAIMTLPWVGALVADSRAATATENLTLIYLGLFPTAVAFTTYAYALRHMSAAGLGVTTYLVPPIAIGLGWLLLGEAPPPLAYVGGILALVGVALARRKAR